MNGEYDGRDMRSAYEPTSTGGMPDDRLPPGWTFFDPNDGEAGGEEAYMFANGHQVLIGKGDDGWFVIAYPEQGMADLCGFVRPLCGRGGGNIAPEAGDLTQARDFAHGYMTTVAFYEAGSLSFDLPGM